MTGDEYLRQLWDGQRKSPSDRILKAILRVPSVIYSQTMTLRAVAYRIGLFRSFKLPKPVVSVGNLTVGGTGKTPMAAFLARWFMARGKRVAVLSRGYGGSQEGNIRVVSDGSSIFLSPSEAGDEPYLLASSVPGLAVVIGSDRHRAGLLAIRELNPDILILDDGYQHLRLQRDLNLLLLDHGKPVGKGYILPAGPMREPSKALERADLVIYTRCRDKYRNHPINKPVCFANHRLTGFSLLGEGEPKLKRDLKGLRVAAFAGIADPNSFFESLKAAGVNPCETLPLPDHVSYGESEIKTLSGLKERSRADSLVTTEKDAVKLYPFLQRLGTVYSAKLEMEFADTGPLEAALEKLL
jgi:tetraacyldisaccharide 4'-kinase